MMPHHNQQPVQQDGNVTEPAAREPAERIRLERLNQKFDALSAQFKAHEVARSVAAIALGALAHEYVLDFIGSEANPRVRRGRRAEAVKRIHNEVGRFTTERRDINREIGIYHVAVWFGRAEAETLPISALKAFVPLLKRDPATENYQVAAEHVDPAKQLWTRLLKDKVTIGELRDKVRAILNPHESPARSQAESQRRLGPDAAAAKASQVLASAADAFAAYQMLGQRISAQEFVGMVQGLTESIAQDRSRVKVLELLASTVERAIELCVQSGWRAA